MFAPRKVFRRQASRRSRQSWWNHRHRPPAELLEDRVLLAIDVPTFVDTALADIALFAPGTTRFSIPQGSFPGTASKFYRFAGDSATAEYLAEFTLAPNHPCADGASGGPCTDLDAAIGIFDNSGYRIAMANLADSSPAVERLSVDLARQTTYLAGLFFGQPGPVHDFVFQVQLDGQSQQPSIELDPQSGMATRVAAYGDELFNSPGDVDYYPLDTLNAGATSTLDITPIGHDVSTMARVFRFDTSHQAWVPAHGGTLPGATLGANGAPLHIPFDPPAGANANDADYLLAVAPFDFNSAAGAYQLDLQAPTLLGPALLANPTATDLLTLPPIRPGQAERQISGNLSGVNQRLYRFRVPHELVADEAVNLTVNTTMFAPVLSIYDVASGKLVDVASRSEATQVTMALTGVAAGDELVVRVGAFDKQANDAETFELSISTAYDPSPLSLNLPVTTLSNLDVGPAMGATIYRIEPAADADVIAMALTPSNPNSPTSLAPTLRLVGPTGALIDASSSAGQPLLVAADLRNSSGPYDLYVAGTSGNGTATLQMGFLSLDDTLVFDQLPAQDVNLLTGDLADTASVPLFGSRVGVDYYQPLTDPKLPTSISATGLGGARPVIGYFERVDGLFELSGVALPPANATQVVATPLLRGNDRQAIAAWNIGFDLSPTAEIQLQVDGPEPLPVEVGMVPDLKPEPPLPPGEFQSILRIDDVTIEAEHQQHLFKTLLPNNIVDLPRVILEPDSPQGSFQAVISVYDEAGLIAQQPLEQWENPAPGSPLNFVLDNGCIDPTCQAQLIADLRGAPLWFVVDPKDGQLGDGIYSLRMIVATDEPFLYEVVEQAWRFPGSSNDVVLPDGTTVSANGLTNNDPAPDAPRWGGDCNPLNRVFTPSNAPLWDPYDAIRGIGGGTPIRCVATLPTTPFNSDPIQIVDVIQNQFGDGIATGGFWTTRPYTDPTFGDYALDVFRFWVTNPGPVSVRTVALADPNDPDANPVNTALKLYRAGFDVNGAFSYLVEIEEVYGSRDWFGANRSLIDSQTYINDFDFLAYDAGQGCNAALCYGTGGGMYFAVVKNQEASLGAYRIEVDAPSFLLPDTAFVPPATGGSVAINAGEAGGIVDFLKYYPIQLPDYHQDTLDVSTPFSPSGGHWDFELFDDHGRPLDKSENDIVFHGNVIDERRTIASFTVPSGPRTVYLRANEQTENPSATSVVDVTVDLMDFRAGFGPPPDTLTDTGVATMLPTDPYGDGGIDASFLPGTSHRYVFQAPAGVLSVEIAPDQPGNTTLRWGVYANVDADADLELLAWDQTDGSVPDSTLTQLLLPKPRQPIRIREFAYDVRDLGDPVAPYHELTIVVQDIGGNGGGFHIRVDSDVTSSVCSVANPEAVAQVGADPIYAFTSYHDEEVLTRVSSQHLQSPTLETVECSANRPMRNQSVAMNPLSPSALASLPGVTQATGVTGLEWTTFTVPDHLDTSRPLQLQITPHSGGLIPRVEFRIYDRLGNLVAEDVGFTLVNTAFTFDIPTSGRGAVKPGAAYYLRTGISFDAHAFVDVTLTATLPKNAVLGNRPPALIPDFASNQASYSRLQLGPDGQVQSGSLEATGNVMFWVNEAGVAHFETAISITEPGQTAWYVALYRGKTGTQEFDTTELALVDFANESTKVNGLYLLDAYVEPGLYAVVVRRTSGTAAGLAVHAIDLPDARPERIVIDPNFGSSLSLLWNTDRALPPGLAITNSIPEEYRSTYYRVTTPAGSLGGTMAWVYNLSCATNDTNDRAFLAVWQQQDDASFTRFDSQTNFIDPPVADPAIDPTCSNGLEGTPHPSTAFVQPMVNGEPLRALPFDEFIVAFDRRDLATKASIAVDFEVPQSGMPDLVVESLNMLPDGGETDVRVGIRNVGYAPAKLSQATIFFTGYAAPVALNELPLGPFGARVRKFPWVPLDPEDHVVYVTDSANQIEELFEDNNSFDRQLKEVDAYRPTVTIALGTPARDGQPGAVWGRYISKVSGVVSDLVFTTIDLDTPADTDKNGIDDHCRTEVVYPDPEIYQGVKYLRFFGTDHQAIVEDYDLGMLFPNTSVNHNEFTMLATDCYGLKSDFVVRTANVQPSLGWLTGEGSGITFNPQSNKYELVFHNELIDFPADPNDRKLNNLLGADIPFVGNKENRFLIEIDSAATASLNPNTPVIAPVTAHLLLKVLGKSIYDQTFGGGLPVTNHVQVQSDLVIDSGSLDVTHIKAGAIFTDLDLYNWQSPEIKLFAFGIPDVASINANLQFGVDVGLNGGVAIALDPAFLANPLAALQPLGLTPKTFIQPNVSLSATATGEVEFLGVDLASLSGGVSFTLFLTYGLDTTDATDVIPFDQFFSQSCFSLDGQFGLHFEADVLGIEVFDTEHYFPQFNLVNVGCDEGILTHNGAVGTNNPAPALAANATLNGIQNQLSGSDPIGGLEINAHPAIALDRSSGLGSYVQVVDASGPAAARGNLAFAHRDTNGWSKLDATTLAQAEHVSNPALELTHDQRSGTPAVVVYQVAAAPDVALTSFNQFLTSQDIRSRYFDGQSWLPETTVAGSDGRFDYAPVVAFNGRGAGVAAWVKNTNPVPVSESSQFDRAANEIMVSVWDLVSHQWSKPSQLTANQQSDSLPSAFVDDAGDVYVVWLQDTTDSNQIMAARYDGSVWSKPVNLPTLGLPNGGNIKQVAIGSAKQGQLDVVITHNVESGPNEDTNLPVTSRLLNRPTRAIDFFQPAYVEQIAENRHFYHLRTLQGHDGLTVYWQQSDGSVDDIFASHRTSGGAWTMPAPLTIDQEIEYAPALSFDDQGNYVLAFESRTAPSVPGNPLPASPPQAKKLDPLAPPTAGNAGSVAVRTLPEISFSRPAHFPRRTTGPAGSELPLHAEIVNLGFVDTDVRLQYFQGQPNGNPVAEELVQLSIGERHAIEQPMEILAGVQSYCILAIALDGDQTADESLSTDDNLSCTDLEGLPDLALPEITLTYPALGVQPLRAGDTVDVEVVVENLSNLPLGPFNVALYQGDPTVASLPTKHLATQVVSGFTGFDTATLHFPWIVPDSADPDYLLTGGTTGQGPGLGHFVLTAVVDDGKVISEAVEGNNDRSAYFSVQPDPSVAGGPMALTASLIDHSGVDNVQVSLNVTNQGTATATNVAVSLEAFLDDMPHANPPSPIVLSTLAPGETAMVSFIVDGLAGINRYRAIVNAGPDRDLSNNTAHTMLIVQGLPDLVPSGVVPTVVNPRQGDPLSFRANIDNTGIASAQAFRVEVFAGSGEPANYGLLVGSTVVDQLAPLDAVLVEIPVDTSQLAGWQRMCVVVDRWEHIFEQDDRNNVACTDVFFTPTDAPLDVDTLTRLKRNGGYDAAYDFDNDRDIDDDDLDYIVTRVLGTNFGDANLDRIFNSSDLIQVLQIGEYDDQVPGNSTWAEGDWNGDGEFDSGDLVKAFQAGAYSATAIDMALAAGGWDIDPLVAAAVHDDRRASEPLRGRVR